MWQKIRAYQGKILIVVAALLWLGVVAAAAHKCFYPPASGRTVFHTFIGAAASFKNGESPYFPLERGYQYSPAFAAALTPLTHLPPPFAALTWSVVNLAVLFLGAYFFARRFLAPSRRAWFLIAIIPLAWEGIYVYQSNPLLGGLLMLGTVAVADGKFWRGAVALLMPGIVKIAPFCFPILTAAVFPRRLLWRYAVAVLLGALFLCLWVEPAYLLDCFRGWLAVIDHKADMPYFHDMFGLYQYVTTGVIPHRERIYDMRVYRVAQLAAAGLAFLAVLKVAYRGRGGG
ncbi:hypothetical protein FACS1894139_09940 [Planctomycetales bacterium]|nr:hypothetical protein FACS1894107_01760 [Planctomycetales bacterium]GHS97208.1 hypothetical protein FACS1894108_03190 [Planctomycetales bacterium]GHT05681.1 hypothetical protein FACS1894139_09940 [Planctomycetales bacterium]